MANNLILGGAGFIGSNLARSLVNRGDYVRIFTRPSFDISNLEDILDRVDIIYGDFMDDVALKNATKEVDTVYHLISTTFPGMTIESSVYDLLSNLLPTIRLAEISISNGIRKIIYASSGGTIYGEPKTIPIREDHPLMPKSAYGQSKLTIENYLTFYARSTDLEVDVLRMSNPYGPGQNPFGVQGLIGVAMGCAHRNDAIKIYGEGETVRDYLYIDDVINAMLLAGEKPGSHVVNISSGKGYSVIEIVQLIEEISGRSIRKKFIPARPGDVAVNILSNELAGKVLGWSPTVEIHDGLTRTWAWINQTLHSR